MSSCEKCWRDAHSVGSYGDVTVRYRRLMEERRDNPCTPEEQAGPDGKECPGCKRMSLHQYTDECMNKDHFKE